MSTTTATDICDFLGKAMRELADSDASAEEMSAIIERAKAMSLVAQAYTGMAKAQLDAVRIAHDTGLMPSSFDALPAPNAIGQ